MSSPLPVETPEKNLAMLFILISGAYFICNMRSFMYVRSFVKFYVGGLLVYRVLFKSHTPSFFRIFANSFEYLFGEGSRFLFVLEDIAGILLFLGILKLVSSMRINSATGIKKAIMDIIFPYIRHLPPVKNMINKEKDKAEAEFERDLKVKSRVLGTPNISLPSKGKPHDEIICEMSGWNNNEDSSWETGHVSGAVYHGVRSHQNLLNRVFGMYSLSNPLHSDMWPSVMKYEAEIISMTASLVGGGPNGAVSTVCGSTTSGGTESIVLAIKSHRDYFRCEFGIVEPEMIACISAHAAVDKACEMLGIKLLKVGYEHDGSYRINVKEVSRAVSSNTILIYSSAPCYPQGVIDDISALSRIAKANNVGLHVDCCLGGFVLPFARKLGYAVPDFDFSLSGVTSMSLDTHKYGYALKGTSVVLYRNREIRSHQYFCYSEWTGGLYTTPTIAGSRSGGLIAQCWASMMALGEEGYMQHARDILNCAQTIAAGVREIEGVRVIGHVEAMIVCFEGVGDVNIYGIGDRMTKKGWSLNTHQNPASLHICCTVRHVGHENDFLNDLKTSVEEVKADPHGHSSTAAIYGMTSSLPSGPVEDMLKVYNDVVLKV